MRFIKQILMVIAGVCCLGLWGQAAIGADAFRGATPAGTSFNYQGLLKSGGNAVNGDVDLRCRLYDAVAAGNLIGTELELFNVAATDGVFSVELDFGSQFTGSKRWLEIDVKLSTDPPASYETLSPRQEVKGSPFSLFSLTTGLIPDIALTGTYSQNLNLTNAGNTYAGDGSGLSSLNAAALSSGTVSSSLNFSNAGNTYFGSGARLTNLPWASLTGVPAGFADGVDNTASVWSLNGSNAYYNSGSVGIGTSSPNTNFRMVIENGGAGVTWKGSLAAGSSTGAKIVLGEHNGVAAVGGHNAALNTWTNLLINPGGGNVGIGTNTPTEKLDVAGRVRIRGGVDLWPPTGGTINSHMHYGPNGDWYIRSANASGRIILQDAGGNVGIGTDSPTEKLDVAGRIRIRGGADIVEGFDTSCGTALEPGTVVVIDPTPGKSGSLMQSTAAYDFKVAGVVSGANGLSPGIHLGQESVMDGDTKVAMTGRVYVKCTTENGAIVPGDLLTTASLAGHAMKATDRSRSHGAVIGKAMSALDKETGLVLVLVNLQ